MLDAKKTKENFKFSMLDGAFASSMIGFTQDYFTPFLLLLGATAKHVGMLSALPNLFASLSQLKSADIAQKFNSRKKVINALVLLQAFMLLPIGAAALLRITNPYYFIGLIVLFTSFGALANPAWGSLMSDFIPDKERGAYFGYRNKVLGFIVVGAAFFAGLILNTAKRFNVYWGFAIIFFTAFAFRIISWYFLRKMHEPLLIYKKEDTFNFVDFISRIRESNFAKFVLFVSAMSFSVNLASPFFSVFMLRDLRFSYLLYTFITIAATLTIFIMMQRWGAHADKVGNLKIIKITSPLIGIIPLFWIFNHHPGFLILAQIFSGFMWAGFNLCTSNFIYDAVSPEKRTRCIAYFNVLNGLALCCGALLGGFLVSWLPPLFGYKILTLFLISSILRVAVAVYIPKRLKEVRSVDKVKSNDLFFSVIGIRPMLGVERKTIRY
ncbi:MAG: MFS transporter [Candidatus Omnitrophota bacterium]